MPRTVWLSHFLENDTPLYGDRERVSLRRTSSMEAGDPANNTRLESTLHAGTNIDFPFHFHPEGQTLADYPAEFWICRRPLLVELAPKGSVIFSELLELLEPMPSDDGIDLLLVKTGDGAFRDRREYMTENHGFDAGLYRPLLEKFPGLKILGFDTISVSSILDRTKGREAHRAFLDPERPLLLLEDMNLGEVHAGTRFHEVIVAPLPAAGCDGLPCSVLGRIDG